MKAEDLKIGMKVYISVDSDYQTDQSGIGRTGTVIDLDSTECHDKYPLVKFDDTQEENVISVNRIEPVENSVSKLFDIKIVKTLKPNSVLVENVNGSNVRVVNTNRLSDEIFLRMKSVWEGSSALVLNTEELSTLIENLKEIHDYMKEENHETWENNL